MISFIDLSPVVLDGPLSKLKWWYQYLISEPLTPTGPVLTLMIRETAGGDSTIETPTSQSDTVSSLSVRGLGFP